MRFSPSPDSWDIAITDELVGQARPEILAAAALSLFTELPTRWIGGGKGRDVVIERTNGEKHVEVTEYVDPVVKGLIGAIFKGTGYEEIDDPRLSQSILVFTKRGTNLKLVQELAADLVNSLRISGDTQAHDSELWQLDNERFSERLTSGKIRALEILRTANLTSATLIQGRGKFIRTPPIYGGTFDGTSSAFDSWLSKFITSDQFKTKIAKLEKQEAAPVDLFVWLDTTAEWAATMWIDHGEGTPLTAPELPSIISALWVGVIDIKPSVVKLENGEWTAHRARVKKI